MSTPAVPASLGMDWLRQALRLLRRRPVSLIMAMLFGTLTLAILLPVPWVGQVLFFGAMPPVALGMLAACRAADRGEIPNIAHYVEGLRGTAARRGLLALGALNAAVLVPLTWLSEGLGMQLALPGGTPDPGAGGAVPIGSIALQFLLSLPMLMAMLLAPPLVAWKGLPAGKAMFFSLVACWRNRWPLALFVGVVLLLGVLAEIAIAALASLVTTDPSVALAVAAPASIATLALFRCGNYRMYEQLFDAAPAP